LLIHAYTTFCNPQTPQPPLHYLNRFVPPPSSPTILGNQIPQREVIHHILNLLDLYPPSAHCSTPQKTIHPSTTHPIFNAIATPPQRIILQIQDLKSGMEVFDELAYEEGDAVVTESN
jgi:hypothetical protein